MTTFRPARCRRRAMPLARSPPPRSRIRADLFVDMRRLRRGELFRLVLYSGNLLAQHMAERIEQQKNKQEEKCVKEGKGSQSAAGVDDDTKDFLGRLGRVL